MNFILLWILKHVFGCRVVMAVFEAGDSYARIIKYAEGGKAFVKIGKGLVGFLDNPSQKEGEFRKNCSAPGLVKWFDL